MNRSDPLKHNMPVQAGDAQSSGRAAGLKKPFLRLRRHNVLDSGGWRQPSGSPALVIPPLIIALERWVDEGGSGDDPDDDAWLNPARTPPHRPNQ